MPRHAKDKPENSDLAMFLSSSFKKSIALGALSLLALTALTQEASANWVFSHMETSVKKGGQSKKVVLSGNPAKFKASNTHHEVGSQPTQLGGSAGITMSSIFEQFPHNGGATSYTCTAELEVTVTPYFKWEGEYLHNDPETDEEIYTQPTGQPFWICERTEALQQCRGASSSTVTPSPRTIGWESPSLFPVNAKSGRPAYYTSHPLDFPFEQGEGTLGLHLQQLNPGPAARTHKGPSRSFKYTISATKTDIPNNAYHWLEAQVRMKYEFAIVTFEVSVKKMPVNGGNANYHEGKSGPIYTDGNQTQILAGGRDKHLYKAEVFLNMTRAFNNYLPPQCFPTVVLKHGDGVAKSAVFTPKVGAHPVWSDSNWVLGGYHNVYLGEVLGHDVTSKLPSLAPHISVTLEVGKKDQNPSATIETQWDDMDDVIMIDPPPLLEGKDIDVEFRPKWASNPITEHEMSIAASKVKISRWLPDEQKMEELTLVRYERDAETTDETWRKENIDAFIEIVGDMTESGEVPGLYKGKIRIHAPENVTIHKIWIRCFDREVCLQDW